MKLPLLAAIGSVHALSSGGWQTRLDKALLDVDASFQSRLENLQRVITDPKVVQDVRSAVTVIQEKGFKEGHPDFINTLFPAGTTARSDLEGLQALSKQLPELAKSLRAPNAEDLQQAASNPPSVDVKAIASELAGLAFEPTKQEELCEELKNALRSTPKGLETPRYQEVAFLAGASGAEIDIRRYAPFTVARRAMSKSVEGADGTGVGSLFGGTEGGDGFQSLASYLFGNNLQKTEMSMTMPVEIRAGSAPSMAFVLPQEFEATPPEPVSSDVSLEQVPERLVAVKPFPGIVTSEEIERQLQKLLAVLSESRRYAPLNEAEYSVLQYNAPYTVPWRRRNELAVVVVETESQPPAESRAEETGPVVSWYDSGIRLSRAELSAGQKSSVVSWYDSGVRL